MPKKEVVRSYQLEFVIDICNLLTFYLNQHSEFFKTNSNKRIVNLYDNLKTECAKARLLYSQIDQ